MSESTHDVSLKHARVPSPPWTAGGQEPSGVLPRAPYATTQRRPTPGDGVTWRVYAIHLCRPDGRLNKKKSVECRGSVDTKIYINEEAVLSGAIDLRSLSTGRVPYENNLVDAFDSSWNNELAREPF